MATCSGLAQFRVWGLRSSPVATCLGLGQFWVCCLGSYHRCQSSARFNTTPSREIRSSDAAVRFALGSGSGLWIHLETPDNLEASYT